MEVSCTHEQNLLDIVIKGQINSQNAFEFEQKVVGEVGPSEAVIIDAKDLEYISSAGLRVILALKKKAKDAPFQIVNVSKSVKEIFDVTGFSEIMEVHSVPREVSVEGCERIGAGACGECFRLDEETIIKLYYSKISKGEIETEKALAKKAFVLGVPTAISYDIVSSQGRLGVVYELIKSKTLAELVRSAPEKNDEYTSLYAETCLSIHQTKAPMDGIIPSFKAANRKDIEKLKSLAEEERELLRKFIDMIPEGDSCIHGDLNMNNIMVEQGRPVLIDMGEFSYGIPAWDMSRLLFSFEYAAESPYNPFYKMEQSFVKKTYESLFCKYYGVSSYEEVFSIPGNEWLHPLAWFRCCTTMLKPDKWPKEKYEMALSLFHDHLIPFIKERL